MNIISKMLSIMLSCSLKATKRRHAISTQLLVAMKRLLERFNFELQRAFSFSCTLNNEATSCR